MNTLGPYTIEKEIGRGGMGVVLRARGPDGGVVAIKVLLEVKEKSVERFDRERRLLAALGEEQGFVPLLDAGTSPRGPWLAMPFLEGGTLRDRLEKGPLAIDEVVALGKALGTALGHAHRAGIVHRDLKPENVLHTKEGKPLVADLGLAKHFEHGAPGASQSVALTRTGELRGTAAYMAPEQLNDAKSVGPPADVFALGAILYECLAGEPAFAGDSIHATFAAIAQCKPRPLRELRKDTPAWLAGVIGRALQAKAGARLPDGAALTAALESAPAARGRGGFAAVLAIGLVALAAGALALRPGERAPEPAPTKTDKSPPEVSLRPETAAGFPAACKGFLQTKTTKLGLVLGSYARRPGVDIHRDGKGDRVEAVVLSPDGKRVLSGSHGNSTLLYREVATGKEVCELYGHTHRVTCAAISKDGKRALSGAWDTRVKLWDLTNGKELGSFEGHSMAVRGVAFVKDETVALSVAEDCALRLQDLGGAPAPDSLGLHKQGILGLALTPGGAQAVTPSWDHTVGVLTPPGRRFTTEALVQDMRQVDRVLRLYTGHTGAVHAAVVLPSGERVVSGGEDKALRVWELATLADVKTIAGHEGRVNALAVVPPGRVIASSAGDRTIRFWDLKTGDELDRIDLKSSEDAALALAVTPDGKHLLAGTERGLVLRFDLTPTRSP